MLSNHCHTWVNRTFRVFQPNLGKMRAKYLYVWVNRNFHKSDFLTSKMHPTSRGLKVYNPPYFSGLRHFFRVFSDSSGFSGVLNYFRGTFSHFSGFFGFGEKVGVSHFWLRQLVDVNPAKTAVYKFLRAHEVREVKIWGFEA